MKNIKKELYKFCQDTVQNRMDVCKNRIAKVHEDLAAETKSSAGDKHETGRAMLQLEREKLGHQLVVIERDRDDLEKVGISKVHQSVRVGSLVLTSAANYFIALSAGEVTIEGNKYYAVSAETPIGKVLIGRRPGEYVNFRNQKIKILEIL